MANGAEALTKMPLPANSIARDLVIPIRATLDAA
jgi:hypothetical protein